MSVLFCWDLGGMQNRCLIRESLSLRQQHDTSCLAHFLVCLRSIPCSFSALSRSHSLLPFAFWFPEIWLMKGTYGRLESEMRGDVRIFFFLSLSALGKCSGWQLQILLDNFSPMVLATRKKAKRSGFHHSSWAPVI